MNSAFTEGKIRNLKIKNRIVLPPMVCFKLSEKGGYASLSNLEHYEAVAEGGTGLIIVEAAAVMESSRLGPDQLGIWSDDFLPGLKKITEACHKKDAKAFLQLFHGGEKSSPGEHASAEVKAPSKMNMEELKEIQKAFIHAALRAEKAGFDGVELHGAHSYLFTQLFSEKANHREDEYGGSLKNRVRFAIEILNGIRKEVSDDFVIGIRMGCNEGSLETSIQMAKIFEEAGMDYLHISTGYDNEPIKEVIPKDFPFNWIVYGAVKIKEKVGIPVIGVNSIKTGEQVEHLIENELVDFVAVGRGHLVDPKFTKHIKDGMGLNPCLGCKPCKWFRDGKMCPAKV